MEVLTIEYEIVHFENKNIDILVPLRVVKGVLENNAIKFDDEVLPQIMDAYSNGKKHGFIEYLELDIVKEQFKDNKISYEEGYELLKEKYKNEAEESVFFIENGKFDYLNVDDFTKKYDLIVDYENSCIKEVIEKDYTCRELVDTVSKSVLFQKNQIKRIVSTIINNYHFTNKKKIILNGKTGTGKTQIVDILASILDCPIVKINGYNGESLTSAYYSIYMQKQSKTGPSIIFIDDIHRGYKQLDILEGDLLMTIIKDLICKTTKMPLQINETTTILFDPSDITFILAVDLEKHVFDKRVMGINPINNENKALEKIKNELVEANFDILDMNNLTENNLLDILKKSKISPINEYKTILESQSTRLVVSKKAYEIIAHKAYSLDKGAKGLRIITDRVMGDLVAEAQYRESKQLILTEEKVLKKLNNIKG